MVNILFVLIVKKNLQDLKTAKFMKDHYVLITRIFDERVKNFIQNVLLYHHVEYYAYRVEFQMRGMPHIHGVLWLNDKEVGHILNEERQFDFDKVDENDPSQNQFIKFAEEWTSCALPKDDKELYDKVKSNQMHNHRPTCKKKGTFCRFNFPKLPSN